jgi:hypothetical protein
MSVRPYASRPGRLARQVVIDLLIAAWATTWIAVATLVYRAVGQLGAVGFRLRDGAGGVVGRLHEAGSGIADVPLVGGTLASPLRAAGASAVRISVAGQQFGDDVTGSALPIALALVVMTVVPVVVPWLVLRVRYARRAGAALTLARTTAGTRTLALRALVNAPARRLATVHADPVTAFVEQDPAAVTALAGLELRRLGLRARAGDTGRRPLIVV